MFKSSPNRIWSNRMQMSYSKQHTNESDHGQQRVSASARYVSQDSIEQPASQQGILCHFAPARQGIKCQKPAYLLKLRSLPFLPWPIFSSSHIANLLFLQYSQSPLSHRQSVFSFSHIANLFFLLYCQSPLSPSPLIQQISTYSRIANPFFLTYSPYSLH